MAKKKKHRKSKAQKLKKQSLAVSQLPDSDQQVEKSIDSNQSTENDSTTLEQPKQNQFEQYVRYDVRHSLVLVAIVLVVFVIIWVVLEKTPVGVQVFDLVKL